MKWDQNTWRGIWCFHSCILSYFFCWRVYFFLENWKNIMEWNKQKIMQFFTRFFTCSYWHASSPAKCPIHVLSSKACLPKVFGNQRWRQRTEGNPSHQGEGMDQQAKQQQQHQKQQHPEKRSKISTGHLIISN